MAHPAMGRACDVSRRQHMPCRPRVPTPGNADGFTGRRSPGAGRCRLAGGRLRAGHRPGPPFRADAVVATAIGNGTKIRDGNVAGWRDRQRKIDDGRGGMDSRGSTTHRIGSGSTLIRRPPDGQRAPRHDAEAAAPGASASARRRMTDNHQALQCREEGRSAPASPRNRFAAGEKTLLQCSAASLPSASAPARGQGNAGRHRPPASPRAALHAGATNGGADVCRQNREQTCVELRRRWPECRTAGSPGGNPEMSDSARQQAAHRDRRHDLRSVGGRPMGAHIRVTTGRRIQAIDLPAMAHDDHNRPRVLSKGIQRYATNISSDIFLDSRMADLRITSRPEKPHAFCPIPAPCPLSPPNTSAACCGCWR